MAQTQEGKKKVYVHKGKDGRKPYYRSTPNTSTGKKSGNKKK